MAIAVDGQQGLDMAGSENTDLGLLDVSLPVMDGRLQETSGLTTALRIFRIATAIAMTSRPHLDTVKTSRVAAPGCLDKTLYDFLDL